MNSFLACACHPRCMGALPTILTESCAHPPRHSALHRMVGSACALLLTSGDRVLSSRKALGPADTSLPPSCDLLKLDNYLCREPGSRPLFLYILSLLLTHNGDAGHISLRMTDSMYFSSLSHTIKGRPGSTWLTNSCDCTLSPSLRLVNHAGCWTG